MFEITILSQYKTKEKKMRQVEAIKKPVKETCVNCKNERYENKPTDFNQIIRFNQVYTCI